jgi:hypothetical protein
MSLVTVKKLDSFTRVIAKPELPYGVGAALPRYRLVYEWSAATAYTTFIRNIQRAVCNLKGVEIGDMLSARRTAPLVRARMMAVYLAKKLTKKSLPEIGRRFGGRDHTTILHSVRKIEAERAINPELDRELNELEAMLVASPSQTEDAPCSSAQTAEA